MDICVAVHAVAVVASESWFKEFFFLVKADIGRCHTTERSRLADAVAQHATGVSADLSADLSADGGGGRRGSVHGCVLAVRVGAGASVFQLMSLHQLLNARDRGDHHLCCGCVHECAAAPHGCEDVGGFQSNASTHLGPSTHRLTQIASSLAR